MKTGEQLRKKTVTPARGQRTVDIARAQLVINEREMRLAKQYGADQVTIKEYRNFSTELLHIIQREQDAIDDHDTETGGQ